MGEPEYWLRGALPGVTPELQPVAQSLMQSMLELEHNVLGLDGVTVNARPGLAASIAFHARHIAGSIDRLLTYAAGKSLSDAQRDALAAEKDAMAVDGAAALEDARQAIDRALVVVRETDGGALNEPRAVGSAKLPSTVRGLLFHIAEHTLMHSGQIRTTRLVLSQPDA